MYLNSKNKRILILGDIHQEIQKAERILEKENWDIFINLGDEFDSFIYNTKENAIETCNFIKRWIFKKNVYFCVGNHNLPYFYNNSYLICSGFDKNKKLLIEKEFGELFASIRDKFNWYIWIDNFLCTHAGLSPYFLPEGIKFNKENISEFLELECRNADLKLIQGDYSWVYTAGYGRGGRNVAGGLTWLDWNTEFEPIEEINQILGHSFGKEVRQKNSIYSKNYCIDTNLNQYLIIENGQIEVKNYVDL